MKILNKKIVEYAFVGGGSILFIKSLDLSPISQYLGTTWYYWFGLGLIMVLIAQPIANKLGGE